MPQETTVYNRERLYAQVWAQPMSKLAKEYGVTDVALRKMCVKLGVPLPPQGHWVTEEANRTKRPPLPPLARGQDAEHVVTKWKAPPPAPASPPSSLELATEAAFAKEPACQYKSVKAPFPIAVPTSATKLHRIAATTLKALQKSTYEHRGEVFPAPGFDDLFRVRVSKPNIERSMLLLSALANGVEKAGHKVRQDAFIVDGEVIEFDLTERQKRVPAASKFARLGDSQWEFVLSGRLRFSLSSADSADRWSFEWEDTEKQRLEDRLKDIFDRLFQRASDRKVEAARKKVRAPFDRQEQERKQRLAAEEAERRWKIEQQKKDHEQRVATLVRQADDWHRAAKLRQFIDAVRAEVIRRFGSYSPDSSAEQWLRRASAIADEIDPMPKLFGDKPAEDIRSSDSRDS